MASFVGKPGYVVGAIVAGVVLVAGGITAGGLLTRGGGRSPGGPTAEATGSSLVPSAAPSSTPTRSPTPVDPLTGGKVSDQPVIAVKVENTAPARPQVGLAAADIVVVEEVEGGLTRLIAVYHTSFPSRVGPVRSARNTDVEFLPLFGRPGLVYSGANRRVQANIEQSSILALPRSTRDGRRVAPHNVIVDVGSIEAKLKLRPASSIGWTFADAGDWAEAKQLRAISTSVGGDAYRFAYSGRRYIVRWQGQRYTDGDTGAVTKADNVVVLAVRNRQDGNRDVNGASSVKSETIGRGKVTIYSQGKVRSGTWVRTELSGPLRFVDAAGQDISLAQGSTWLLLRG